MIKKNNMMMIYHPKANIKCVDKSIKYQQSVNKANSKVLTWSLGSGCILKPLMCGDRVISV